MYVRGRPCLLVSSSTAQRSRRTTASHGVRPDTLVRVPRGSPLIPGGRPCRALSFRVLVLVLMPFVEGAVVVLSRGKLWGMGGRTTHAASLMARRERTSLHDFVYQPVDLVCRQTLSKEDANIDRNQSWGTWRRYCKRRSILLAMGSFQSVMRSHGPGVFVKHYEVSRNAILLWKTMTVDVLILLPSQKPR